MNLGNTSVGEREGTVSASAVPFLLKVRELLSFVMSIGGELPELGIVFSGGFEINFKVVSVGRVRV